MKKDNINGIRPSVKELELELQRVEKQRKTKSIVKNCLYLFLIVAALTVLVSTKVLPIFRIYGSSMEPTLRSGEIIVAIKTKKYEKNDIVAFYYNNKILVKRVIAIEGQWVDMDENGKVKVDGIYIDEPYILNTTEGECDLELPYQVPDGSVFVMGDNRLISMDSRSNSMGAIPKEQMIGKLMIRLWPLQKIGILEK